MKMCIMVFTPFTVYSYDNGLAYDVICGGEHFFLQGGDAIQFHDECESRGWVETCHEYMYAIGEIYA